jgi:hypothetical protein
VACSAHDIAEVEFIQLIEGACIHDFLVDAKLSHNNPQTFSHDSILLAKGLMPLFNRKGLK